jgi:predicted nucleic acid-binding protein
VDDPARNLRECERLIGALDAFDLVEATTARVARALQVQRLLAARSHRGRKIPDLLVAAVAEAHGLTVLHYDADFHGSPKRRASRANGSCPRHHRLTS